MYKMQNSLEKEIKKKTEKLKRNTAVCKEMNFEYLGIFPKIRKVPLSWRKERF